VNLDDNHFEPVYMQLIRGNAPFKKSIRTVITIGNFDGVHLGHQALIQALLSRSQQLTLPSILLTFEPHPKAFFSPHLLTTRLMRFREKWVALLPYQIDYLCCLRFDKTLAMQSAENFIDTVLIKKLNAQEIIIGDNFRFGANRAGDVALLHQLGKRFGFRVTVLPQVMHQSHRVSSSYIRKALKTGDFDMVRALTGRTFFLLGKIIHGEKRGRQLGFPTANIFLNPKQTPLMGVFIVRVFGIQSTPLLGVASIGYRPTFHGKHVLLEIYLFDFNKNIYGARIRVEFLKKIREEEKFDSVTALIAQMKKDTDIARHYFRELGVLCTAETPGLEYSH